MQGHELASLVASIDWNAIIVALITLSGVVFNGLVALYIARYVRTPSGMRIGKQVEWAHHTVIANSALLRRVALKVGVRADDPEVTALLEEAERDAG